MIYIEVSYNDFKRSKSLYPRRMEGGLSRGMVVTKAFFRFSKYSLTTKEHPVKVKNKAVSQTFRIEEHKTAAPLLKIARFLVNRIHFDEISYDLLQ